MVDFKSILGTLLESGMAPAASQRIGHAMGDRRVGGGSAPDAGQGGSDLGSLLGGLLGNAKQAAGDTKREVEAGNPMAVGGLGALAGAVLGGMRGSPARGALGGAALAVLGQIAMSALQKGMGGTAAGGADSGQPGLAEAPAAGAGGYPAAAAAGGTSDDGRAQLLLRAMINAAKADGQIDGAEMNRIMGKLDEAGADQEAKDFVLTEMRGPLDVDGLAAAARGAPDVAAAVYAASVMAIRVDTAAERTYLDQLAARLGLAASVRASLDASLGVGGAAA
jgi:uncharacterized membrane protein YebE (DUF533 family)